MSILRSAFVMAVVGATLAISSARAEDLAGSVAAKLRESGSLAGYRVNVKAKSGTVWLEGRVADEKQLAAAVSLAETTPGVERVVNRLTIAGKTAVSGGARTLGLPDSARLAAGIAATETPKAAGSVAAQDAKQPAGLGRLGPGKPDATVTLAQALTPSAAAASRPAGNTPRPLALSVVRPAQPAAGQPRDPRAAMRGPVQRTSMRGGISDPMHMPSSGAIPGVADGQMVPGSMRIIEGGAAEGAYPADSGVVGGGGVSGGPIPMGGTGVGMPPIPGRADGPNMPNYAWPSYAASPNVAAVQYPTQYSPTAWPYIGPFYPYPQVPLGWRRVSLEWDDGWWWLDFDERHIHSHHR